MLPNSSKSAFRKFTQTLVIGSFPLKIPPKRIKATTAEFTQCLISKTFWIMGAAVLNQHEKSSGPEEKFADIF